MKPNGEKRGEKGTTTVSAERPGLGSREAGRSALPTRSQPPSLRGATAAPAIRAVEVAAARDATARRRRRENRVQCDCAEAGRRRGAAQESSVRLRRLRGAVAGPSGVESGPTAALVSFAELGGAEEDEVAAGSDAAR